MGINRKLRVALDVDGVLRDFTGKVCEMYEKESGKSIRKEDITKYGFLYDYKINEESLAKKIWGTEEWLYHVFMMANPIETAKEGYELLCGDSRIEVYIVSAQNKGTEHLTENWLKKHGFDKHVKEIYTKEKLKAPCQVLIDDKKENVFEYNSDNRLGIMISQPWNQDAEYHLKAQDLIEAYNILDQNFYK